MHNGVLKSGSCRTLPSAPPNPSKIMYNVIFGALGGAEDIVLLKNDFNTIFFSSIDNNLSLRGNDSRKKFKNDPP